MKNLFIASIVLFASTVAYADATPAPVVSGVSMVQGPGNRLVTISYTLSDSPAVITLDIQTNVVANATSDSDEWASIGGEAIWNASGDVWKKVGATLTEGNSVAGTITWRPDLSWPDHKLDGVAVQARAVVTAYAVDNPPDYMVLDLLASGVADSERYYPGADFLPKSDYSQVGAITNNPAYKTTKLVMRKIMAKNIRWTMGSYADGTEKSRSAGKETVSGVNIDTEAAHEVELTNNYYMAVFETTQAQWAIVVPEHWPSYFTNTVDRAYRPVEQISYAEIRAANPLTVTSGSSSNFLTNHGDDYLWPNDPHSDSFLGRLHNITGLKFDLPSEAEWEFACRAGNGNGKWGNGETVLHQSTSSSVSDANLAHVGRYNVNHKEISGNKTWDQVDGTVLASEGGTAIVGSYQPNSWGLYDMHGNLMEICLDWYEADISTFGGKVNLDPVNPTDSLSGTTYKFFGNGAGGRVRRGGAAGVTAPNCRSAYRKSKISNTVTSEKNTGFRIVCPID